MFRREILVAAASLIYALSVFAVEKRWKVFFVIKTQVLWVYQEFKKRLKVIIHALSYKGKLCVIKYRFIIRLGNNGINCESGCQLNVNFIVYI